MDKLWDLMVMLFKWQLTMIRDTPNRLLELTFRHMDGAAKLMPEMKKTLLVDTTKRCLIDFWDVCSDVDMVDLLGTLLEWMTPFNVKISILIRSGLQLSDGSFEAATGQAHIEEHFGDYLEHIGENIYARNANGTKNKTKASAKQSRLPRKSSISNELSTLANQLNIDNDIVDDTSDMTKKVAATALDMAETQPASSLDDGQPSGEGKTDLIVDDVNCSVSTEHLKGATDGDGNASEFIYLKKTTSALQGYLEQFEMENTKPVGDDGAIDGGNDPQAFDATEELLKMLEDKDNGAK